MVQVPGLDLKNFQKKPPAKAVVETSL